MEQENEPEGFWLFWISVCQRTILNTVTKQNNNNKLWWLSVLEISYRLQESQNLQIEISSTVKSFCQPVCPQASFPLDSRDGFIHDLRLVGVVVMAVVREKKNKGS